MQPELFYKKSADFSPCRVYRYTLRRLWRESSGDAVPYVNFICLNPSTADADRDDPTSRKCVKFADAWGYGAMVITNLFAFRATDRKALKRTAAPIGDDNDRWILDVARDAGLIVLAWSADGCHRDRSQAVLDLLTGAPLHCLRITKGEPWHPLYLPDSTQPQLFYRR